MALVGIKFPSITDRALFGKEVVTAKIANDHFSNLMRTIKGERVFEPSYGMDWGLFEPGGDIEKEIEQQILTEVDVWIPWLTVDKINVDFNDSTNKLNVSVSLSLNGEPTGEPVTFDIDVDAGADEAL